MYFDNSNMEPGIGEGQKYLQCCFRGFMLALSGAIG